MTITIACKARDLKDVLAESIRRIEERREQNRIRYHAIVEEAIQASQRCPYVLTQAGLEAARKYDRETLELIK